MKQRGGLRYCPACGGLMGRVARRGDRWLAYAFNEDRSMPAFAKLTGPGWLTSPSGGYKQGYGAAVAALRNDHYPKCSGGRR